jgi:predicted secreted hydrolase
VGCGAAGRAPASAAPASSAAGGSLPGSATTPAVPASVRLPADQAAHPGAENEWWYAAGQVEVGGRTFGYEVQIIPRANILGPGQPEIPPETIVSITDVTVGRFFTKTFGYAPGQGSFSTTALDASTPSASLSGPLGAMHLHASLPAGSIDLTLDAQGPVLYNNGDGVVPFLGGSTRYYSLPDVATSGTITENGHGYQVRGTSWLDHQWGNWNWADAQKWTWMGIRASNGDSVDLWDIFSSGRENSYATVLEADGKEQVVPVTPLAASTAGFVTSPATGQRYGSKWLVCIPDLKLSLTVQASPRLQEVQGIAGIDEAASTVTGRIAGLPVTGQARVEQFGNWRANGL